MKLVKLLSVGQSLKSGKTILGKYKLTQQSLLPKFAATFRPISPDTFAAPSAVAMKVESQPVVAPIAVEKSIEAMAPAPVQIPVLVAAPALVATPVPVLPKTSPEPIPFDRTQRIPNCQVLRRVEEPVLVVERISFVMRIRDGVSEKISALKQRVFPPRSRRKPFATPVQTEWSLEKVTVVRNDLSESDLEVVSPKTTRAAQIAAAPVAELHSSKHATRAWFKKTAGLFKASSPFESGTTEVKADAAPVEAEKHRELAERI